jgi:hypothetical protein
LIDEQGNVSNDGMRKLLLAHRRSLCRLDHQKRMSAVHSDTCRHCIHVEPEGVTDLTAGFLRREVKPGIFLLTNGNYQSLLITTGEGVVLVDAPEPLIGFIEPAVVDVTDEPITTLIYSHGYSNRIGDAHQLARPGLEIIAEERAVALGPKIHTLHRSIQPATFHVGGRFRRPRDAPICALERLSGEM